MDLQRYAKYVLADQFQVNEVHPGLLCVMGPFCFGDGQFIEIYVKEDSEGVELIYYSGLAEVVTLETLAEAREDGGPGSELFLRHSLRLHSDRLAARTTRDGLLEGVIEFADALRDLDRLARLVQQRNLNP